MKVGSKRNEKRNIRCFFPEPNLVGLKKSAKSINNEKESKV